MIIQPTTESLIAELLDSAHAQSMDARAKYLFRESLFSLVRFAKAEQMMEIKNNVAKLTAIGAGYGSYALSEEEASFECLMFNGLQRRFEFHEPD